MIDAPPSATPMPAQPVATVTSAEALPPPPDPLPHAVAPAVTVPSLESRLPTGRRRLRPGTARRDASSSSPGAMRYAAASPSASRLGARRRTPTSSPGAIACACAPRSTSTPATHSPGWPRTSTPPSRAFSRPRRHARTRVLLAGHMRDLWDGGAAIVAAMTDDTVAGGGIRVTTPLDLWVHGLMGVEERIGTCTADAVLLELGATHYEREYGPGAHAAGLAVYVGSLYQSNRSTFRPLMRVSRGVRNLIAGRGGGGGGGDRGAAGAPGASPPPVPAQTGAPAKSATGTLAAGRRADGGPDDGSRYRRCAHRRSASTTRRARERGRRTGGRRDGRGRHRGARGGPSRRSPAPPTPPSGIGALQGTLRMDAAESGSEAAGGFRASAFE